MIHTLASWNVNGIRAAHRHGLLDWLDQAKPDILCLQEIKAVPEQLPGELLAPDGYIPIWQPAERKGYSGVAAFVREEPEQVCLLDEEEFDREGRVLQLTYPDFVLINGYFPNSQEAGARLDYKLRFCQKILERCEALRAEGRHVVVCGDFNIAHKPIDLKNPQRNEKNPGYLPEERAWMDAFIAAGYSDTFRMFHPEPEQYSWWSYRFKARERNIGWRIDYFCVDQAFEGRIKDASIYNSVTGSDHCPVWLELK